MSLTIIGPLTRPPGCATCGTAVRKLEPVTTRDGRAALRLSCHGMRRVVFAPAGEASWADVPEVAEPAGMTLAAPAATDGPVRRAVKRVVRKLAAP